MESEDLNAVDDHPNGFWVTCVYSETNSHCTCISRNDCLSDIGVFESSLAPMRSIGLISTYSISYFEAFLPLILPPASLHKNKIKHILDKRLSPCARWKISSVMLTGFWDPKMERVLFQRLEHILSRISTNYRLTRFMFALSTSLGNRRSSICPNFPSEDIVAIPILSSLSNGPPRVVSSMKAAIQEGKSVVKEY